MRILKDKEYSPALRIGIVVDSFLDIIPKVNNQELPIHDNFYLPKNFQLIFATADGGSKEYIPNFVISECDRLSKEILNKVLSNPANNSELNQVNSNLFSACRGWSSEGYPIALPQKSS